MEKTKCSVCERELPITSFWRVKAPGRKWENHKIYEKPYHICKKCCEHLIKAEQLTVLSLLEDLDIPFWEREWNIIKERYPETSPLRRYIARMYQGNLYGLGYEDTIYLNQKKYKIIALIGEAGSGKDFLMKMLLELHDYHEIISCTSRPMREGEKNGRNYYFYTDEYFMQLVEENKMMEWASFNNWYYGTPLTALSKDKINIGVFNPAGIRSMLARDDIDLRVFYVSTSPKTRLLRQLNREEYPNVAEIIRRYGTDVEDFKNIDFPCTVVGNENFQEAVFATHDIKWVEDNSN